MVQIKKMQKEDLEKISDFSEFDEFWNFSILEQDIKEKDSRYYQAIEDDEICGILAAKQILEVVEIRNLVVRKDKRQKGIGTKLFTYFLEEIKKDETVQKVELEVSKDNKIAIYLYESHGFKRVGERPRYYNNKIDAILMNFEKENP